MGILIDDKTVQENPVNKGCLAFLFAGLLSATCFWIPIILIFSK